MNMFHLPLLFAKALYFSFFIKINQAIFDIIFQEEFVGTPGIDALLRHGIY